MCVVQFITRRFILVAYYLRNSRHNNMIVFVDLKQSLQWLLYNGDNCIRPTCVHVLGLLLYVY